MKMGAPSIGRSPRIRPISVLEGIEQVRQAMAQRRIDDSYRDQDTRDRAERDPFVELALLADPSTLPSLSARDPRRSNADPMKR